MFQHHSPVSAILPLKGFSDDLVAPQAVAGKIENFALTREGTLRVVARPSEYLSRVRLDRETGTKMVFDVHTYTRPNGLFHTRFGEHGAQSLLFAHIEGHICVHHGWEGYSGDGWKRLLGPSADHEHSPGAATLAEDVAQVHFPTQFIRTPSGVLIIPQGDRAYLYDGDHVLTPLGYSQRPTAPIPLHPRADSASLTPDGGGTPTEQQQANEAGFSHTGRTMRDVFGPARVGTLRSNVWDIEAGGSKKSNPLGAELLPGAWQAQAQWINKHGDLSPLSARSAAATCRKEDNLTKERKKDNNERGEELRFQLAWDSLDPGPDGTVGRIVGRTRDLINSGDPAVYELPSYTLPGGHSFATVPDNITEYLPDNTPDAWLVQRMAPVDPVPTFRLAVLWAGRLWVANVVGDPGQLRASLPGRFGTFPEGRDIYYPDPTGGEITGLYAASQGLLVFTERSTFLLRPNDQGTSFIFQTLDTRTGCVAPGSIQTLRDGRVIWLAREGFVMLVEDNFGNLSLDKDFSKSIEETTARINRVWRRRACSLVEPQQGEYRCWVPVDGATENTLCIVFDGEHWRTRTDVKAQAVCVTDDSRELCLALGKAEAQSGDVESLWVLDRSMLGAQDPVSDYTYASGAVFDQIQEPTAVLETHWLRVTRSHRKGSPVRIHFWLRETVKGSCKVEVFRDQRDELAVQTSEVVDPTSLDRYGADDPPFCFDDNLDISGSVPYPQVRDQRGRVVKTNATWRRRRLFWSKYELRVPSVEVFKVRVTVQGDAEFAGLSYVEHPWSFHGGSTMVGGKTQ